MQAILIYNMTTTANDGSNTRTDNELAAFDDIKQAVIESCSLHYPDDKKTLIIKTDASDYGWGSVLFQVGENKKECYSENASIKAYEDYIYDQWFYVNNDHQNLLLIAVSEVSIIVRMRLYMQSHVFFRKYVKGTDNWAADFKSRMHESHKANVVNTEMSRP